MGNYATTKQVKNYKKSGQLLDWSGYTDDEISTKIDETEQFLEERLNDIFYTQTATYYFDGSGTSKLFFKPTVVYPIISITSVKEYYFDGSTVLYTYTENTDYKKYDYYLDFDYGETFSIRTLRDGVWPRGSKNIEIVGTWGRSTTPSAIKNATILLTIEALLPGRLGLTDSNLSSIRWPDVDQYFRNDRGDTITGFNEIDNLVSDYINHINLFNFMPYK